MTFIYPIPKHSSTHFPGSQPRSPFTRKDAHDPEPRVEQSQRICHQTPHTPHPPDRAKHPTTAVGTPTYGHTTNHISHRRIHRYRNPYQTRRHQRQKTIPQHTRASRKRKCATQRRLCPSPSCPIMRVMMIRTLLLSGHFMGFQRWRHERENPV